MRRAALLSAALLVVGCSSSAADVRDIIATDPPTVVTAAPTRTTTPKATKAGPAEPYFANCTEAKKAGAAPLRRGKPGYRAELDRDKDGVACET